MGMPALPDKRAAQRIVMARGDPKLRSISDW
jgi:hypothetical protein